MDMVAGSAGSAGSTMLYFFSGYAFAKKNKKIPSWVSQRKGPKIYKKEIKKIMYKKPKTITFSFQTLDIYIYRPPRPVCMKMRLAKIKKCYQIYLTGWSQIMEPRDGATRWSHEWKKNRTVLVCMVRPRNKRICRCRRLHRFWVLLLRAQMIPADELSQKKMKI